LKAAAAKLKSTSGNSTSPGPLFTVIVAEGAPEYDGHDMAASLAAGVYDAGGGGKEEDVSGLIETIVISDAATVAIMARVHKVILPAHAVLANGGLIAPKSGSHMVALAARLYSVPVLCCTGMFKLTPQYPHEQQNTLNDYVGPSTHYPVVDYATATASSSSSYVEYINPVHDYIRPDLITLYVTNVGSFQPSYIYRLLAEYYHPDDWESFE
jgi:translation initiation factor eIF-2B subunit beta